MKKATGFTLIEILIALSVFVILATITSSSLYYAFTTRSKVNAQADRLNGLQLAISILEQDTLQMMDRAVRSNEMRLFPNFIGLPQYMEYTRGGVLNPKSAEKRSTLKRIALACQKGSLVRRSWDSLDPPDHQHYHEKVLINHINECHFNYLNQNLQTLPEWREQALNQEQKSESFPTALQINLTLADWGTMNLLFIIPEALYVPK